MFLLMKDRPTNSSDEWTRGWSSYLKYLELNRSDIPVSAYEFAVADWHYDFRNHQCPHDAWVESVAFYEKASGKRSEIRSLQIKVKLLAAYHDGNIEIEYIDVNQYKFNANAANHGDWLYDEIRISQNKSVVHEIEFSNSHWYIECADIKYTWNPK